MRTCIAICLITVQANTYTYFKRTHSINNSSIRIYPISNLKKYFLVYKIQISDEKWRKVGFFAFFFRNTSKVHWFCKFRRLHRKNHIKIYQTTTSVSSIKYLTLIKNIFLLVKKWEIQVTISMITRTRSSDRIFNPMRFIDYYTAYKCTLIRYCLKKSFRIWNIQLLNSHRYSFSFGFCCPYLSLDVKNVSLLVP